MILGKHKLGEYIELLVERNSDLHFGVDSVRGINNLKKLMPTKADLNGRDISKFQIVHPNEFVFNHRTSRNGSRFSIAINDEKRPIICTEDYVVFKIKEECDGVISAQWLYMFFNRPEFDRYVITNSWGSSTEFYNWSDICDVEIILPSYAVQKKYVDVYNALVLNQQSYERGLEDLKLTCDAYVENLRRESMCENIGPYIELVTETNSSYEFSHVKGVESSGSFMDTRANMQGVDIGKYTVVREGNIVYNPSRINIGSIALYNEKEPCIASPMYSVFKVKDTDKIIPEYLMLWFGRTEFQRYTWFFAAGSVRDTFEFSLMKEVMIPLPKKEMQVDIVNIYHAYCERKRINQYLKNKVNDICSILIKGSIEEG